MFRSFALSILRILLLALGIALLALTPPAKAQRRSTTGIPTNFDDVVFAFTFSPDARTLAIARGARDPVYRFGRIELWDTETGKLRHLIKGFDGPVKSISFSPDGQTLISSSLEFRTPKIQQKARSREGVTFGELKWWDTQTGELKHKLVLPGEGSYAIRATQSPDGKQLALTESFRELSNLYSTPLFEPQSLTGPDLYGGRPYLYPRMFFRSQIKLVDAQTGEPRFKLDVGQPGATGFSPDGNLLAVTNGKEVKLLSTQTGKEVGKLKDLKGAASAIAFAPNSRSLAVASTKYEREYAEHFIKLIGISEVKLFEVATGKVTLRLKEVGAVNTLAFSPDGRILVIGGVLPENKGQVAGMKLYDFQTLRVTDLTTGADYKEAVDSLVLSRDGSWLAFAAGPATVKLLDTRRAVVTATWNADSVGDAVERPTSRFLLSVTRVMAVAFSPDGKTVSGESDDGEIKFWDHRTGEVKRQLNNEQDNPTLVAISTDGKSFAEVRQDELFFWNANTDAKRTVPLARQETATALALSADGQILALADRSAISLLSPIGDVSKKFVVQEGIVGRLAFSNDGRLLAGVDQFGNVRIWNVGSGRIEKTLTTQAETTAMVFAPSGQTLATAARDNTVSIWNLQTGLPQGKFQKHDATINALAFSPNGQWLASGSEDRTIVLWEVAAGKSKRTFKGHEQTVTSLAFSPDSRLLASGSGNASVVVWEVSTGKLSRVLK
jgi:WD40 repeat protein